MRGPKVNPNATPITFARAAIEVAMDLSDSGNQMDAILGGGLSKNGCPIAFSVCPAKRIQKKL
jgi:hypothetical protein